MGAAREHVERGLELWNKGDVEALVPLTAQDATSESPLGNVTGVQAIIAQDREYLIVPAGSTSISCP